MVHLKIKFLFPPILYILVFSSCQTDRQYQRGFTVEISHTSFLEPQKGWSKVYSFKPISMNYQPEKELIVISRAKVPDSLHLIKLSKAEQGQITREYGDFRFLGAFEDHNVPPEMSHLFYVNLINLDILQVNRITSNAAGKEKLTGAILYMKDSTNYMKDNRLFFEPGE